MTKRTLPAQDYLIQCFEYDSLTGALRWRRRPSEHFRSAQAWRAWNTKYAGKAFGCGNGYGYTTGGLDGVNWFAHRIIWKMVHNADAEEIDHVNRDRSDNRLSNLRAATSSQNKHNTTRRNVKGRVSRFKGVSLNWGKWAARICVGGKTLCLGTFNTEEEAAAAYARAASSHHGDFANY